MWFTIPSHVGHYCPENSHGMIYDREFGPTYNFWETNSSILIQEREMFHTHHDGMKVFNMDNYFQPDESSSWRVVHDIRAEKKTHCHGDVPVPSRRTQYMTSLPCYREKGNRIKECFHSPKKNAGSKGHSRCSILQIHVLGLVTFPSELNNRKSKLIG